MSEVVSTATLFADDLRAKPSLLPYLVGYGCQSFAWSRFEQLVGEAYWHQGYQVHESGGTGPDEGIDLTLMRAGTRTLVQCKHWRSNKVGVPVVREHLGVMTAHSADHVLIVCTGKFSESAIAFAVSNGIEPTNGTALIHLVKQVQGDTPPGQSRRSPSGRYSSDVPYV